MSNSKNEAIHRDRTEEFISLRKAARQQSQWIGTDTAPAGTNPELAAPLATPNWVGCLERCRDLEFSIRARLEKLHGAQQQSFGHKGFSFDDEDGDDENSQRRNLDGQAKEIAKLLKELERMVKTGVKPEAEANDDEAKAALSVQKHLVTNLTLLVGSFKDGQDIYNEQQRRRDAKTKRFKHLGTEETANRLEQQDKEAGYLEMGYSKVEIQELMTMEAHAQEQNKEVQEIMESVKELHEMFQEMHELIVEQGTVLDRIDYNINCTVRSMEKGNVHLDKARDHQKKCVVV